MPRLDDSLINTKYKLERLKAVKILNSNLFTFSDRRKGDEEVISK